MISIEWIGLYFLLGAFVGFMAGLLGVGGGGILVPLFASIFGYQGFSPDNVVHLALGTSLACMIISSTASIRAHAARGTVVWKVFCGMAPGIMVGAFLTTRSAAHIDATYIAVFFAFFMALIAIQMFISWKPKGSNQPASFYGLLLVGMGIGSVSALASVGGGFLAVMYLSYKNVAMKNAIGTAASIGLPIAIAGTIGYLVSDESKMLAHPDVFGFIHVPAFLAISLASAVAAPYGARFAHSLPEKQLKKIFALISLALSIKMLASITQV